jgi:hypothetical protein
MVSNKIRAIFEHHILRRSHRSLLCKRCGEINWEELLTTSRTLSSKPKSVTSSDGPLTVSLGPRGKLNRNLNSQCPACSLILKLLWGYPSDDSEEMFLIPVSSHSHLAPEMDRKEDDEYANYIYIARKHPDNPARFLYSSEVLNAIGDAKSTKGLAVQSITPGGVNVELVHQWIALCEERHAACSPNWHSDLTNMRLINVKTMTVVNCTWAMIISKPDYLCLSYVWGPKEQNIKMRGSRLISVPRTIKDAIEFVRRLDKTYLWVDSVCLSLYYSFLINKSRYASIRKMKLTSILRLQ